MMTRKDYARIADAFNDSYADHADDKKISAGVDVALANVSTVLADLNPRFDPNKFLAAATENRKPPLGV